ncbi:MAG: Bor family protein [Bacteriovoracia bacterium]
MRAVLVLKRILRGTFVGTLGIAVIGCGTVTLRPDGAEKIAGPPTWERTHVFFLGGIVGEHHVDVQWACGNRDVLQMQTQFTPSDVLVRIFTLMIFSPRTAKVWCGVGDRT